MPSLSGNTGQLSDELRKKNLGGLCIWHMVVKPKRLSKTVWGYCDGLGCLLLWHKAEEWMLCKCEHLVTNQRSANLGFFWNEVQVQWHSVLPISGILREVVELQKNKSSALTRTGGLICQILVRCCHQDCCRHSFIYKGSHPDLKIRSIITTRLSWSGDRWLSCVQYQDSMWHFCLTISPPLVKWASWLFLSRMKALIPKSYKVDLGPSFPLID